MNTALNISSSPHARHSWNTAVIMRIVILSLLPTALVGVIVHGWHALWVILCAVATAVVSEYLFDKVVGKPNTVMDGSAVVTGLMLALCLAPNAPLYLPVLGSLFAIVVVKGCFGGLGKNFVNPALAGRCFLLISFGRAMSMYGVDAMSSATPVALLKTGESVDVLRMFLGTTNGVIGNSVAALLLGGMILWAIDVIHGEICFSVLGGFTLCMALFGGKGFDPGFLLAHLCGGGVVMGAFYMATDYVTSPVSRLGQMTYGLLIGALGALFRIKGGAADSFSYSVIIGNLFVPLIDLYVLPKPFAYRRKRRAAGDDRPFWKRIPKPVIALTAITIVAGVALSGVFSMTKETIEEQRRAAREASYRVVCPAAESFEPAAQEAIAALNGGVYGEDYGKAYINEAYTGLDAEGGVAGYVLSATSGNGYDGNITLAVGLDPEGMVNGIAFTELNETPGMGMRASEPDFAGQFAGKKVDAFTHDKSGMAEGEDVINAISGASTTSGAVVNAVNAALDFFRTYMQEGA